jgi:outer membrane protein insertion porin family
MPAKVVLGILLLGTVSALAQLQSLDATGVIPDPPAADIALPVKLHGDPLRLIGGFASVPGSFAGISWTTTNLFGFQEILNATGEIGDRLRRGQIGITRPSAFGTHFQVGAAVYGQRFHYNEERESSLTAFDREIPQFDTYDPNDVLNYISTSFGATVFAQYPVGAGFSHFDLMYGFDVSRYSPETVVTSEYFSEFNFQGRAGSNELNSVRTSKIVPSYTYNTVDNAANPTKGAFFFALGNAGRPRRKRAHSGAGHRREVFSPWPVAPPRGRDAPARTSDQRLRR